VKIEVEKITGGTRTIAVGEIRDFSPLPDGCIVNLHGRRQVHCRNRYRSHTRISDEFGRTVAEYQSIVDLIHKLKDI